MKFQPKRPGTYWKRHPYGQSVRIDDHVYVPIPKSASTWCKQIWSIGQDFDFLSSTDTIKDYVVILRDPVDRWISGFAQCQVGNDPGWEGYWERLGWQWVFDTMVFDNHTEPQCSFLGGLDLSQVTWFKFGDSLEADLLYWMNSHMGLDRSQVSADRYSGQSQLPRTFSNGMTGRTQKELIAMASEALECVPNARDRVLEFYHEDIKLFNQVDFYRVKSKER